MYFVYIMRCKDNSLYTGTAADLCRRMAQHTKCTAECAKYTRSHPIISIEAVWYLPDKSSALKLEYAIKQLSRASKEKLIKDSENISAMLPKLSQIECRPIENVTLDDCLSFFENRMSESEKRALEEKLSARHT